MSASMCQGKPIEESGLSLWPTGNRVPPPCGSLSSPPPGSHGELPPQMSMEVEWRTCNTTWQEQGGVPPPHPLLEEYLKKKKAS